MKTLPLSLDDLAPQEATFKLSEHPDKTFTLCKWSLRVRAWAIKTYGSKRLTEIFEKQSIIEIAEICFYMLKEKDAFKDFDAFAESVVTVQDHLALSTALLGTIGIGEPKLQEISEALKKDGAAPLPNVKSPKRKK